MTKTFRSLIVWSTFTAAAAGLAGCSAIQLRHAAAATQQAQDITSPTPLNNSQSNSPTVTAIRPIVQTAAPVVPDGQAILGLISGLLGVAFGGLQLAIKSRTVAKHQAVIAKLASSTPPTSLSPSEAATVAQARAAVARRETT